LIERDKKLGGTCLLRGCIPTKSLLHTASLLDSFAKAGDFGVDVAGFTLDMEKAIKRKERVVAKLTAGVAGLMKKYGVTVFKGHGRLAGKGVVEVEGETRQTLQARHVILATGSEVKNLPFATPDHQRILTSDSILDLTRVPKSLVVLGAGAVGMEFASIFRSFGAQVTLVEMMPHLLPLEDEDVSKEIEKAYKRRKIEFRLGAKVQKVETTDTGVRLAVAEGEKTETLDAEALLVAVGRKPVIENLGLETAGVKTERGFVLADSLMRTNVENIWAIGDLIPTLALAHVASHEGVVAADAIAGKNPTPINYDHAPSATYTAPEVASVGLTEKKARERGHDVKVGTMPFAAIGKATISGENEGFVKIVADAKYGEVLGVHIVGPHATELIAEACTALTLETTAEEIAQSIHAHPTLSEAMGEAAHGVLGHTLNF
ncbi:MAG: dihydrolipoyl dehydrogenase, partial [Deltaproteobacteria bacterium]|nr:dihydrolipoyl dehydrogenase [Deltaproteobacteria bacterium]